MPTVLVEWQQTVQIAASRVWVTGDQHVIVEEGVDRQVFGLVLKGLWELELKCLKMARIGWACDVGARGESASRALATG